MPNYKKIVQDLLDKTDIKINGSNPWDIQVKDDRFYKRAITQGSLGLGESYMDGWWDAPKLDVLFEKVLEANIKEEIKSNWKTLLALFRANVFNLQKISRAFQIGKAHYDIGNDLYKAMLDKRLVYTCAYFKDTTDLDSAQEAKLDLVCRKIGLKKNQKILDIGCGWGSFAKYAAQKYEARVVGITVSKSQVEFANKLCQGLPIEIRLQDYRDIDEKFDHIVSLGMFEHVGYKNYRTYMQIVKKNLKEDGLFLLHTIGNNYSVKSNGPWIEKYIFPNSMLPSVEQIAKASQDLLMLEDWHNFGSDYDKTLMAWFKNFDAAWDNLKSKYDDRFYRMWKYYLLSCAALFRTRQAQLWQIVYSKNGVKKGHKSIR